MAPPQLPPHLAPERGPHDRTIMAREFMQRAVQRYSYHGRPIGLPGCIV